MKTEMSEVGNERGFLTVNINVSEKKKQQTSNKLLCILKISRKLIVIIFIVKVQIYS